MKNSKLIGFQILVIMMISCNPTHKYTQDVNMEYVPEYPNIVAIDIEPKRIYKLSLDEVRFYSLPDAVRNLSNLRFFEIAFSSIENWTKVEEILSNLKNIETIIIAASSVDTVPIGFNQHRNLEKLDLIGSKNYDMEFALPKMLSLQNLRYLSIGGLQIDSLPLKFSKLQIEELEMGHHTQSFDYDQAFLVLSKMVNLKNLRLGIVDFTNFPSNFQLLTNLRKLRFLKSKVDITVLFTHLKKLNSLEWLEFENMKLTEFPDDIVDIEGLKCLKLFNNPNLNHPRLFKQLAQLPNLEELDLSATISHEIHTDFCFPPELAQLKNLKKLDISTNQQLVFDTLFDLLSQLPNLEKLRMHDIYGTTNIVQLPDKLKDLTSLKELDISYNGPHPLELVTELPESLEKLDYSMSRFNDDTPLQKVVFTAKNLKSLNLSDNLLKELPEEIGNLKNLVHLDLSYNQIRDLPESITQCKKLKYLNLMYTYIAKDKEKRKEIEEMLPNTLIFFGEYEVWDPENN
jgi:Leucine-rich repeat (LRR) protein